MGDSLKTSVDLNIEYDVKKKRLCIKALKHKEVWKGFRFDEFITKPLYIYLSEYDIKVKTLLAETRDTFNVFVNDVDFYEL